MSGAAKQETILSLIAEALPSLQNEIAKAEKGEPAIDILRSLRFMKARLEDMEQMIRSGTVQKDPEHKGSMSHLVLDTWPRNDPLGSKITQIEYDFYRLR